MSSSSALPNSKFFPVCVNAALHLLFAFVGIGLRHWLSQLHLKLIAAQCHLLVVSDKGKECVEHQVVSQEKLGAARLLTRVYATMLHSPGTPDGNMSKMG